MVPNTGAKLKGKALGYVTVLPKTNKNVRNSIEESKLNRLNISDWWCLVRKCTRTCYWWLEFLMSLINLTTAIITVNVADIKQPLPLQMHSVTRLDSNWGWAALAWWLSVASFSSFFPFLLHFFSFSLYQQHNSHSRTRLDACMAGSARITWYLL